MRGFMEQRFGEDFSGVRVHAGSEAAASASAVLARAYTVGEHIVLGDRARGDDRKLYAHELAHVVQQRASGTQGIGRELEIGKPSDPAEAEADRMAGAALRGAEVPMPAQRPLALRRDGAPPSSAAPAEAKPAPAEAKPAENPAAPSKPDTQFAADVDLGRHNQTAHGRADAVLHRGPAAAQQPCELELFLKIHFTFHLGRSGSVTPSGTWPADRAAKWKRDYMNVAQATWNTDLSWFTKTVLEPAGSCTGEPCTQAVGRLRVVDADAMTDSDGNPVAISGMSKTPHYSVDVFENRPAFGDNASYVGDRDARLYDESIQSKGTARPQGLEGQYGWSPGGAAHETGHMLGRPHDQCSADDADPNREQCYGSTVMGHGTDATKADMKPFELGMKATTGCEWKTTSTTRTGRVLGVIFGVLGGIGAIAGGIALGTYLKNKK